MTHVTILTAIYPPESNPGGKRMQSLAKRLIDEGHTVGVITCAPSYPQSKVYEGYGERLLDRRIEDGVEVLRVRPWVAPKDDMLRRAVAECRNAFVQFLALLFTRSEIVVATSPPITLGPIAAFVTRLKGQRFVWDVRDLFWLYARDLGKIRSERLLSALELLMMWTARRAAVMTTTTDAQRDYFVAHGIPQRCVESVPNGVDEDLFNATGTPAPDSLSERIRIVYAGLIGYPQGIGVLVDAASYLDPALWEIIVAGHGAERSQLEQKVLDRRLHHVRFVGFLSQEQLVDLYRSAHILYAQLRGAPAMATAQPTKVLDYMAAARPVVYGGIGTGAALIKRAGAGIVVRPDDVSALVSALNSLRSPAVREKLGMAGRDFIATRGRRIHMLDKFSSVVLGNGVPMHSLEQDQVLSADSEKVRARVEAQKQWNTNPCGALPTESYDKSFFDRVEADRYRQQYWQRDYFDFRSFRGGRVLEIGVGLGTDLKQFARNGANCFGVDITNAHLDLTQKNFDAEGLIVDLRNSDAITLPFPDNYFDCVYSFGVLHHIPDVKKVLAEVRRVLKPGGMLQVAMYYRYSIHTLALFARAIATGTLFRIGVSGVLATIEKGADGLKIKPYVKLYSRRELSRLVADCGFEEESSEIHQVHFEGYPILNRLRPFEKLFGWYACTKSRKPVAQGGE